MTSETRTPHVLGEPTLHGLAMYIKEHDVRKILVLLGAGVSVAAGIPDFRSPHTGIYANLGKYNLDTPTDAFSLPLLQENPEIFYTIAREMNLWPGNFKPTAVHYFVKLLSDEGRLLRCCTQNIDGLERAAGVPTSLLVEAHGSFSSASCIACHLPYDVYENRREAMDGKVSHCHACGGVVKPDVVFFGEALPERFFHVLLHDTHEAEMVIIIGTSLQVHPFAALPLRVHSKVPRIVFNRERVGGEMFWFPTDNVMENDDGDNDVISTSKDNCVDCNRSGNSNNNNNSSNHNTHDNNKINNESAEKDDKSKEDCCKKENNNDETTIVASRSGSNNSEENDKEECKQEPTATERVSNVLGRSRNDVNDNTDLNDSNHHSKVDPLAQEELEEHDADEEDEEDEEKESSSDGYAQYGEYYNHPHVCRDLFIAGDCQESIQVFAKLLGLGDRLAIAMMRLEEEQQEEYEE